MFGEIAYFYSLGDFKKICNIFYKSKILSSCTFGRLKLAICRNTVSIKKLGEYAAVTSHGEQQQAIHVEEIWEKQCYIVINRRR